MTIFYFTATGNCLYVAKRIGGKLISIPQALKEIGNAYEDDAIGFVIPCWGWGIPKIVKEFIEGSAFKADYFFAVMTYGFVSFNGIKYMERYGEKVGIKFDYTAELLMTDNYLPVYRMEKQLEIEPKKKIEENLERIVQDINNQANAKVKKGFGSKIASSLLQAAENLRNGTVDKKFKVNENCNKCGVCKKVCPVGNITIDEKPTYKHNCIFCLSCINLCPNNAIHLKNQKSKERFRNQNITVKEIIDANNQK